MYEIDDDEKVQIAGWLRARNLPVPTSWPAEGRIVPGVAAGFLVMTDCSVGILDFFVSNPEASRSERDKALDEIAQELIGRAYVRGCGTIRCNSQLDTIVRRARRLGFRELGTFTALQKEL